MTAQGSIQPHATGRATRAVRVSLQPAVPSPFSGKNWPSPLVRRTLGACLNQVRRWRAPPNWSPRDWLEEIQQVARIAASQAEREYDPGMAVEFAAFVQRRVRARALTRYRQ